MKRVTRNGVIAIAAASGAMAVTVPVSAAFAAGGGAAADGVATDSPGLISGNTIQLPAHVPVNLCGNTVNVVGLLNPAAGNGCVNKDAGGDGDTTSGGASAEGRGKDSPGVGSGNVVQVPVHLPVNVSGNSVNVIGVGNPATGNESVNTSGDRPHHPAEPPAPPRTHHPAPRTVTPAAPRRPVASLAHTGADRTLPAAAGSAALVLGGAVLYRRFRPRATR